MLKLIGYRLLLAVPQLLIVSLLVFSLTYLVPGSVAAAILGDAAATPAAIAELEAHLGLDKPFFTRLFDWYAAALQGDLGTSLLSGQAVTDLITQRLPATLSLVVGGLVVAVILGMGLGIFAGIKAGQPRDRAVTGITAFMQSVPEFWLGQILVVVFVIQLQVAPVLAWTPPSQDVGRWLAGLILPAIALGVGTSALIARQTRTAVAAALGSRYIDTLVAAGVDRRRILWTYAFKNALVPALAAVGLAVGVLIGVSLVMEKVFSFPGIGTLMLQSVLAKDFPVVQGVALVVGVIVIIVNMVLDISYGLINPKARPA
ncbi:ABC transporter permease [Microbacterium invictum]|uniref:Peptide/nickel transport system permease protein n=1 Tax=Microbacterium invictum TaxID=515415 RepID=A0AA40SQG1_9MICO|nr:MULTISPECIES: ABC transporter permease [Microbacterium]MBB4140481.1 peptide/nickel transport system permease protein [Microbacterium invictum]